MLDTKNDKRSIESTTILEYCFKEKVDMDIVSHVLAKLEDFDARMRNVEVTMAKITLKTGLLWAAFGGVVGICASLIIFYIQQKIKMGV